MQTNDINLYICHTYYHVLISIIKQFKSNICSDIMLSTDFSNNFLANDNLLIDKLRKSGIFRNIIIFDYSKEEVINDRYLNVLNRIYLGNKIKREKTYDLFKYKNIYIFCDHTLIGYMLNKQKIRYNLLEDGMDCFQCKYKEIYIKSFFRKIYRKIRRILKMYDRGESPYIKTIEVNNKNNLLVNHRNIIECPKKDLFSSLSSKEKEEILKVFLNQADDLLMLSNSILILTQPLFEDKKCSTEEEKIKIYKEVIKEYASNENVIIKIHPREVTDYAKYFQDYRKVKIIKEKFPVEVLNFMNIKFKKVITIFSTSINVIENSDEKIELGYEYINNKLEKK